ncbi:MAG: hypothetical protein DRO18_07690, partial [Thermoprotei archaeon]
TLDDKVLAKYWFFAPSAELDPNDIVALTANYIDLSKFNKGKYLMKIYLQITFPERNFFETNAVYKVISFNVLIEDPPQITIRPETIDVELGSINNVNIRIINPSKFKIYIRDVKIYYESYFISSKKINIIDKKLLSSTIGSNEEGLLVLKVKPLQEGTTTIKLYITYADHLGNIYEKSFNIKINIKKPLLQIILENLHLIIATIIVLSIVLIVLKYMKSIRLE